MDNFNGFPATYQPNYYYSPNATLPIYNPRNWQNTTALPSYQQQQQQMQTNQQLNNNSMIWVQGEAGAKAYIVPNGTTIPLWDSENQVIYIKSVDTSGKPTMTILDYTERTSGDYKKDDSTPIEYATKEQIAALESQYLSFSEKLNEINSHIEEIDSKVSRFNKPHNNQNRKGNDNG